MFGKIKGVDKGWNIFEHKLETYTMFGKIMGVDKGWNIFGHWLRRKFEKHKHNCTSLNFLYQNIMDCLQILIPVLLFTSSLMRTKLHEVGASHIETSPLICRANQWNDFYMIRTPS